MTADTLPALGAPATRGRVDALRRQLRDAGRRSLGFPNATDLDLRGFADLWRTPLNNVGYPGEATRGFRSHTLELEYEVVQTVADLVRAPADDRTGLVTSGSTEAIKQALLHARDRFGAVRVYASTAAHTCIAKIAHQLRVPFTPVPIDNHGELDYAALSAAIAGSAPGEVPLVVATAGTTMVEAYDNVRLVHAALDAVDVPADKRHVHVDAALAGLALIDVPDGIRPAFDFADGADSLNISGHKFLGVPQPCGVLVMRDSTRGPLDRTLTYTGSADLTVTGSRSGHAPLMVWLALQQFGRAGLAARADASRATARQATQWLREAGITTAWRHDLAFTVVLPRPPAAFLARWPLPVDGDTAHIVCMPGKPRELVRDFVTEYAAAMHQPRSRALDPAQRGADQKDAIAC